MGRVELETIKDIWNNRFPRRSPRCHQLIEKLAFILLTASHMLSLSALMTQQARQLTPYVDGPVGVLAWAVILNSGTLRNAGVVSCVCDNGDNFIGLPRLRGCRLQVVFCIRQESGRTLDAGHTAQKHSDRALINSAETTITAGGGTLVHGRYFRTRRAIPSKHLMAALTIAFSNKQRALSHQCTFSRDRYCSRYRDSSAMCESYLTTVYYSGAYFFACIKYQ